MNFLRRTRQTIGLDIGSASIKAAVIDHSSDQPRLVHLIAVQVPGDAIVEGEIMDPTAVVEGIRAVAQPLVGRSRPVVTAVGGRDVIIKKIQMDRMPASDAREMVSWEAERYVPFDMENVRLDFQILDPGTDRAQMTALLAAAKKELIEQRSMLLQEAGLTPSIIDVDAFALFNAFEYSYPTASHGVATLVNVGHDSTTIVVSEDGVPIIARDVSFGGRHYREDLRREHGLDQEGIDAVLKGQAPRAPEVDGLLFERSSELALAIERATAFLSADFGPGAGIGGVYLAGGSAPIPQLQEAIAQQLRVRVELVNPFQRLQLASGAMSALRTDEPAGMWMLPVGLAMRRAP